VNAVYACKAENNGNPTILVCRGADQSTHSLPRTQTIISSYFLAAKCLRRSFAAGWLPATTYCGSTTYSGVIWTSKCSTRGLRSTSIRSGVSG